MSDFPDFKNHGYQIIRELGHNSIGGRVTYLAQSINTQQQVVIKQFQFAQMGASWTEYSAYEQEISVLRSLNHHQIPRYLDSFQNADGFCMVQEYMNASSLDTHRSWTPQQIKQVAISVLEILVYLQSQNPPVIHRDIKPENILMDEQMKVYLVDFGFARMGGGEVAVSSVVKGTLGFMPPEQLFNRELTQASDLYGLGATLICLLTGTKSVDIGSLIDSNYRIHFQHLVPPQERGWLNWLEKMVEPRPQDRYASAGDAIAALNPIDVSRLPKVRLSRDSIEFKASQLGEKVTQTITISNPIPDTVLAGSWEVAPHPSDPPHTPYDHAWISFEPMKFESNDAECQITVDTSKLLASQTYTREVLLRANSEPDTHAIAIKVETAALPISKKTPYVSLGRLGFMLLFVFVGWLLVWSDNLTWYYVIMWFTTVLVSGFAAVEKTMMQEAAGVEVNLGKVLIGVTVGALIGGAGGGAGAILSTDEMGSTIWMVWPVVTMIGALVGASFGSVGDLYRYRALAIAGVVGAFALLFWVVNLGILMYGMIVMWVMVHAFALVCGRSIKTLVKGRIVEQIKRGFYERDAAAIALLTAGLCISLGAAFQLSLKVATELEWMQPLEIAAITGGAIAGLAATSFPLLNLIIFKRARIIAEYRKSEPNLIKP